MSHVVRIYEDDDTTSDTWVDVERIDRLVFDVGTGLAYQRYVFTYDWSTFDPTDPNKAEIKKITKPDDESITLKVPIRTAIALEAGAGLDYQRAAHAYGNDPDNITRVVHTRRVDRYDLASDAIDRNGQPPSAMADYINAVQLASKDDSQFLLVEIIQEFTSTSGNGLIWQKHIWGIDSLSDPLLQFGNNDWVRLFGSDQPDTTEVDPPWRLDPLQNIVNVSWGGGLAVEFGDGATNALDPQKQLSTP